MADTSWYEDWLSTPRFHRYLSASSGDRERALALYEWNLRLSAAITRDISHLEIALRNAYDRTLSELWQGSDHWTLDPESPVTTPLPRTRNGRAFDANAGNRRSIDEAVRRCRHRSTAPDDIITELPFGFWRHVTDAAHEKALWVPYLHHAWASGTDRSTIDRTLSRVSIVRNRAAHHEPVIISGRTGVLTVYEEIVELLGLLLPNLAKHVAATTTVAAVLLDRP